MPLHFKALLCCAFTFRDTTYTRTGGFCPRSNPVFQRVARQNPPVLWLTESACSCPEQPLSATHGRQRYNTLDFVRKQSRVPRNRRFHWILPATEGATIHWIPPAKAALPPLETTANRVLSPLLETQSQRNCRPFGFPARFEMSTHKLKMVCGRSFQNSGIIKKTTPDPGELLWSEVVVNLPHRYGDLRACSRITGYSALPGGQSSALRWKWRFLPESLPEWRYRWGS